MPTDRTKFSETASLLSELGVVVRAFGHYWAASGSASGRQNSALGGAKQKQIEQR